MPWLADGEHAKPVRPAPQPPALSPERVVPLSTAPGLTEIHPGQVDSTAKLFEDSARELAELIDQGRFNLQMQPMANDEVSRRAAEGFTKAAFDGPASHIGALERYRDWLQGIADGIRTSAERYRQTEAGSADGLRRIEGV